MAEISWTSEIIYYSECGQGQNWVSITPAQGTSSSSPIVSVKAATSPNDCPRASIIITSNGETQIIPVVRCLPECECKSINFVPNALLKKLEATGGTVELGKYDDGACVEYMKVITDGTVICEPNIQGGTVTATVQANPLTSPRTGSYKVLLDAEECVQTHEIVQDGKVDPCATAVCPSVTPATMTFESGGGEKTYSFANYDENCWELIGVEKNDWITVNTASTKISVGNYEGTTQRTGSVTFNFVNKSGSSSPCNPSIGITQSVSCTCDDLKVSGDKEINSSKQDNIKIGSFTAGCVTNITVSEPADWITRISADASGNIMASVNEFSSTTGTRATEITVKGMAGTVECKKYFALTQNPKSETCTKCSDANIQNLNNKTIEASGSGTEAIEIGSFSYDCEPAGITAKRVSGENFITGMTVSDGKVYGVVKANTGTTERSEIIGIYIGEGTTPCAQYELTQQSSACTCANANVQVGTTEITLGYSKDSTAETTYSHDCSVSINNIEAGDWLNVNETDGKLKFKSTSQATSPRSANVYINDANGNHCKTIKVTQEVCGDKLNISYGIIFENQPVAVDSLSSTAVYSVGGAKVNYTKCDGSKGSFLISAAYGTTDTFVNFRKGDFNSGDEAIKTTSFTVSDLASIDSITLPQFISVGGGRNIWGTTEQPWGGDFRNLSEKTPDRTYVYECYASCISSDSYISARNTYTINGSNLTIYLSFDEIFLQ